MSDANFYLAVAAAIPALLIAYAVGMAGYAGRVLGPNYQRDTEATVAAFLDLVSTTTGKLNGARASAVATIRWTKNMAFLGAYALAVLIPVAGEVAALYGLAHGSEGWTEPLSWAGVGVGLAVVGIPLLLVGLEALPFWAGFLEWKAMRKTLTDVRSIYSDWERGSDASGWTAAVFTLRRSYLTGREQDWTGKDCLAKLADNAWSGAYPRWIEGLIVDRDSLLVIDRVGDTQGASFFRLDGGKVSELSVYEDRASAEAAHPRLRRDAAPETASPAAGSLPPPRVER